MSPAPSCSSLSSGSPGTDDSLPRTPTAGDCHRAVDFSPRDTSRPSTGSGISTTHSTLSLGVLSLGRSESSNSLLSVSTGIIPASECSTGSEPRPSQGGRERRAAPLGANVGCGLVQSCLAQPRGCRSRSASSEYTLDWVRFEDIPEAAEHSATDWRPNVLPSPPGKAPRGLKHKGVSAGPDVVHVRARSSKGLQEKKTSCRRSAPAGGLCFELFRAPFVRAWQQVEVGVSTICSLNCGANAGSGCPCEAPRGLRPRPPGIRARNQAQFLAQVHQFRGLSNFLSEFRLEEALGEGGRSTVHRCVHLRCGRSLACKVMEKCHPNAGDADAHRMEFIIQRGVGDHENVLAVERLYEDQQRMYMTMELALGGDLLDLLTELGAFSERQAAGILRQLAAALQACHDRGVVHRDVRLENVLVQDPISCLKERGDKNSVGQWVPRVVLADFGSARVLCEGERVVGQSGGSKYYQSPEVLRGKMYDHKADVWSLGVVLFTLLSGTFPFTAPTPSLIPGMVKRGMFSMSGPRWVGVSRQAKDVVRWLLEVDASKRPSSRDIGAHPWLKTA